MLEGTPWVWWASECGAFCFSSLDHSSTLTRAVWYLITTICILIFNLSLCNFYSGLTTIQITVWKARLLNSWNNEVNSFYYNLVQEIYITWNRACLDCLFSYLWEISMTNIHEICLSLKSSFHIYKLVSIPNWKSQN
jgi:hypothetical protein